MPNVRIAFLLDTTYGLPAPFTRAPILLFIVAIIVILIVRIVRNGAPFWAAGTPLKRGEYDDGLRRLKQVEWFSKKAAVFFLKGTLLMFAGRALRKPRQPSARRWQTDSLAFKRVW